jgi:pilus assembly protein CpaC
VKPKIFKNARKPVSSILGRSHSVGLAALLMMATACAAQDLPVVVTPKTAPPTAPAIAVPPATNGAAASVPVVPTVSALSIASIPGTLNAISRNASTGKPLHVILGHSVFIDTKTRLRRVYVSDPAVINSVTLSPNQIIVTAMTPGISSLTLLDETGLAQSYVVSSDVDVEGLRAAMSGAMGNDAIRAEGNGGRVTLTGNVASQAVSDAAAKLAGLYAANVANALVVASPGHPKQVRLEVRILEVDRSKMLQLGLNLFNPGGNTNYLASSTSAQFPSSATLSPSAAAGAIGTLATTNPLNFMLYSAKLNLGATIEDLQSKQVLQILADPTITTISGVQANFLSGGEFPFPVVQPGGSGGAPVVTIQFRQFGVKLEFTPVVNDDGTIRLKVSPEVSALDYADAVTVSGFTIPALSTRRATTEVELRSSQSFAISGLLDQRTTDMMSKNPGAANIPILGNLFKSKNVNHSTTELVIVVTPTVVDPLEETAEPAQPAMPIPLLDPGPFDKSLGKNLNPKPAAPPLNGPGSSPYGSSAPPAPPVAAPAPAPVPAPAARSAGEETPLTAPENAQPPLPAGSATATVVASAATSDPALLAFADPGTRRPAANGPEATSSAKAPMRETTIAEPTKMVEIMALSHESDADAMVAALKRHGYDVAVNRNPADPLLHLDVGPFVNKGEAELMRQRLLRDGYNASIK